MSEERVGKGRINQKDVEIFGSSKNLSKKEKKGFIC